MLRRSLNFNYISLITVFVVGMVACKDEKYSLPTPKNALQNDAIKRSLGPNVVGMNIEFVYAMAIPKDKGKLVSAEVVASIPGAAGTYLEHNSYFTNGSGVDVGVPIGQPSVTSGDKTTVTFTKDTMAAALRYFYVIPEEARGKTVTFTFSVKSSNGESVSVSMGPYTIAKMDWIKNRTVTDGNAFYISISDTTIYTAAQAAANAAKIDLIYLYRVIPNKTFLHALVAPASDTIYHPGITLPAGVNKNTKILKVFNLQDFQLANLQFGIYIDDIDFQKIDLSTAPNFAINMKAESGAWVETADGKYRAYIYINSINNTAKSAVISMKRYAMN